MCLKAMEGALLDVHDLWLLLCLYISGAKVGIECAEPALGVGSLSIFHFMQSYMHEGAGEGGSNPDAVDRLTPLAKHCNLSSINVVPKKSVAFMKSS